MKILHITAEAAPFTLVGGLARSVYFLSKSLEKRGHDVRIFCPLHHYIQDTSTHSFPIRPLHTHIPISIHDGEKTDTQYVSIKVCKKTKRTMHTYFLDHDDYFGKRSNVYDYTDDNERFYLFSRAGLEWIKMSLCTLNAWVPEYIHCHDWHTGYFIDMAKRDPQYKTYLKNIPILYTVHNFKYQSKTKFQYMQKSYQDNPITPLSPLKNLSRQNALERGLHFADKINTVSPTHAKEILTPAYSYNLHRSTSLVQKKISGILNGLDYTDFSPQRDPYITAHFNLKTYKPGKAKNKRFLQSLFSLPQDSKAPLFSYVGRIVTQKGIDLLIESMRSLLLYRGDAQFIAIGDGEERYCEMLFDLQQQFSTRVGLKLMNDTVLPRQIFAGSDMTLVPSIYEPGGIVVLEALRYGSVPIVRRTGGMNDVITDFDINTKRGNGFSFTPIEPLSFSGKLIEVLTLYDNTALWDQVIHNCMSYRHSWDTVADEYEKAYMSMTYSS